MLNSERLGPFVVLADFKNLQIAFSGDSHGDPERTEAAHHQWQDSPSPSPSHSGHQAPPAPGVTRHGQQAIRVSPAHLDQGDQGAEQSNKEKPVNRDLVEMVRKGNASELCQLL